MKYGKLCKKTYIYVILIYVKIITIEIDIHFENTSDLIENSINSEGRSPQCMFKKRDMIRKTAVYLDAYVNVIR